MFECTLESGDLFRKIVVALSDLVEQGNFMVDDNMISFQGMDSSHVSLVALQLAREGFHAYRCDSAQCLGIQFSALNKVLKCMTAKDALSIQAHDNADTVSLIFESEDKKRYSNFELKLNDIDQQQLGIPETQYCAVIKMKAAEFQRICRDLAAIGDTVSISATKEGVKFSVNGDIGSGDVTISGIVSKKEKKEEEKEKEKEGEPGGDEDGDANINVKPEIKPEQDMETQMDEDEDEDEDMKDDSSARVKEKQEKLSSSVTPQGPEEEEEEEEEEAEQEQPVKEEGQKKGKKKRGRKKGAPTGNVDDDARDAEGEVLIELEEPVQQTFSLRYLNNFTKATQLSEFVTCSMGTDVPLEVHYKIGEAGSLSYYLAPKIDDDDE